MKKLLTLFAIVLSVGVSSCSKFDDTEIWDKLNDHESRITVLEELCKQMNTNINALQTLVEALEKRDYITNVSPVRKDGEVIGYTISFANSDTITIYHGENGQDGADGKDGYTPQIGVMKDTDGIYYWTLDGEWLLDGKGNKIQANGVNGIDGTDGSNGEDGTNGVDGITPRLKIENDYWYVSYDEGSTWIELGKATGENGSNGIDGVDGDSIFSSVTQDDEYVYFNLADGTMITLPKHDKENIQFEDLQVKAICCKNWDTNNDGELSYSEAAAVTDIGTTFKGNKEIIAFTEFKYFTGLSKIEESAFCNCSNLWKIAINSTVEIGYTAFEDCTNLTNVIIGDNVTSIGARAFYCCTSLKSITIPDGVTSIGAEAFGYCYSLTSVNIGNGVASIGASAFKLCGSLTSIVMGDSVTTIGHSAFSDCNSLTSIVIGDSVITIDHDAFRHCDSLTSVVMGDSVTTIGRSVFYECDSLTSVIMGDSVITIGESAFYNCHSLTSITIPNSVTSIGLYAFDNCTSLIAVYCKPTTPPSGGSSMFSNNASGRKFYVHRNSLDAYKSDSFFGKYANDIVGYDFE